VAKQGYLAPNDHGGAGSQVAFSYCLSLYALALMFPPKLSSHLTSGAGACRRVPSAEGQLPCADCVVSRAAPGCRCPRWCPRPHCDAAGAGAADR
jgi:hypothetical protein